MKSKYIVEFMNNYAFIQNEEGEPYLVESFEDLEKVLEYWTKENNYTWEGRSIHVDYRSQKCSLWLDEGQFEFFLYKLVKP